MLGYLRLWTARHRRLVSLLAAVAVATSFSVVNAPAAQAYTCPRSGATTIQLNDGSAAATIYVSKNCSDGRSRFSGTVRDIKCDGRSAYLWTRFWNGSNPIRYRAETATAGNGCGTSASFSYTTAVRWPELHSCAYAANAGPTQSSGHCRSY